MPAMNIYSQEDEFIIELREWCKNNPLEIPKDATQKYGAVVGEKMPEVTKQVLREINLGKKLSEETKQKISRTMKKIVPWNVGVPMDKKHREKLNNILSKKWIIIYPNGKQISIKNLSKFCKENNLFSSNMIKVSQGKQSHHRGFICRPG